MIKLVKENCKCGIATCEGSVCELNEDIKKEADRLWENCIHKHITGFTLTQARYAKEDIEKFLHLFKEEVVRFTAKEIFDEVEKIRAWFPLSPNHVKFELIKNKWLGRRIFTLVCLLFWSGYWFYSW